jgi:hypothetical protein
MHMSCVRTVQVFAWRDLHCAGRTAITTGDELVNIPYTYTVG